MQTKKKKKSEKMNKKKYIIILTIILLIAFLFFSLNNIEEKKIGVRFQISERPGFDLNSSLLSFGKIPRGSTATRDILLENKFNYNILISIKVSPEVSKLLYASESKFILKPNEKKNVTFYVVAKNDSQYKEYLGWIKIKSTRDWIKL